MAMDCQKTQSINVLKSTFYMDAISTLYPAVNEVDTPLPRAWSSKDKLSFLGLSNNSLRVHYKGSGKNQKDAASVRATYPIPTACGIYYFEVKVISKGRDGYMGIGLSTSSVSLNRLPGWDKNSYGYHGDDGHSFCSSGSGQTYGPTFTTGDVIGCCVNLIEGTCFYTKNGINLGIAFRGLPASLYPTVGLQTPGEVIEANFGSSPFVFDFEDYIREWKLKTKQSIERCSVGGIELPSILQKIVSSYLVHHGYSETANSFANATSQDIEEDLLSIHNRQKIQKLVLAGQVGEAIACTRLYYPGLLESNASLLFTLKCRQFVELVGGCDMQPDAGSVRVVAGRNAAGKSLRNPLRSASGNPRYPTNKAPRLSGDVPLQRDSDEQWCLDGNGCEPSFEHHMNRQNSNQNGDRSKHSDDHFSVMDQDADYIVNSDAADVKRSSSSNKDCYVNGKYHDKQCKDDVISCDGNESGMDDCDDCSGDGESMMDTSDSGRSCVVQQLCGGSREAIERMLQFGRELQQDSEQLKRDTASCEAIKKSLKEVFSLLAYSNPWNSPVGYQLDPAQREPVCAALNSAILESRGLPARPPLEFAVNQSRQCLKLMAKANIGSCAFADITNYVQ